MNPITQTHNQTKMNQRELELGIAGTKNSWHYEYKDSAWIFLGGLPYQMTEGDIICMLSQYGEICHINLIRDHTTGKSKGFGFVCYMDQRSTILAVDNLNGVKVLGRLIRVDHIHQYKLPKDLEKLDQDKRKLFEEGCAPKPIQESASDSEDEELLQFQPVAKKKKEKKRKKDKKKKKKRERSSSESDEDRKPVKPKRDKENHQEVLRQKAHDFFDVKVKPEADRGGDQRKTSIKTEPEDSRAPTRNRRESRSTSVDRKRVQDRSRSGSKKLNVGYRSRSRERNHESVRSRSRQRQRSRSRDKSRERRRSRDRDARRDRSG